MQYEIIGAAMQTLLLTLDRNESVFTETGSLLAMSPTVNMRTTFTGGGGGVGGFLKRAITGNSLALNHFDATVPGDEVLLSTRVMGHIVPIELNGSGIYVQKRSFLCATEGLNLKLATSLNLRGIFGGNGLLFNSVEGTGLAFLSIDGEVIERELEPGETIMVHPGHLAAWEPNVRYELQLMRGFRNFFFGQDGITLLRLTGPGKIWLHSFTIHNLAEEIASAIGPRNNNSGPGITFDL